VDRGSGSARYHLAKNPYVDPRIRGLLTEPGVMPWFVSAAAANPALPVEDMHRILEEQIARGGY
jgi:hypothetical protein